MPRAKSLRIVSRPSYERFEPRNRAGWRRWLARNHAAAPGVWLVYLKGAARQIKYDEAVEEALCFGWIDSTLNPIDTERYIQLFTPRKPRSGWSRINKGRVEDLLKRGLMTTAGLEKVDAARKDGSWAALDAIEALELPAEMKEAFASNRLARENFAGFSPFSQKTYLYWINNAKRAENRAKRIAHAITLIASNIKHPRMPLT
jgi:uncharacterized protein YdeI (YjbR/CyaY-like superfamily)